MQTVPHVDPRALRIMDLAIQGLKPGAIAERVELSPARVSVIMNAPQFKHQLSQRRATYTEEFDSALADKTREAADIIRKNAKAAAERMAELVDSTSEPVALRASADILDRHRGTQKQTGVNVAAAVVNIDVDAAALIKETLEMDKAS
jgi:uncharacterized protein (DUF4415 family)